jgi:hypothetical protein
VTTWTAGERLFAQYAHAPNSLGYCGPEVGEKLFHGARGEDPELDVRAVARGFSGAWPYQELIAELSGLGDPMGLEVVRAYWTGNEVTRGVSPAEFGTALLERIQPRAGHYWGHLTDQLLPEAAPTHAFHVLAVYPWSRMLDGGGPEALAVLESCRIGWATVVGTTDGAVQVEHRMLQYDADLSLGPTETSTVRDDGFAGALEPGDVVALHWGRICGRLSLAEASELEHWTRWQLEASNPRIRARRP